MRCQSCHEAVPENAKVCGYCGTKLDKNAMIPCPACGEDVPVTAKVCGSCGTRLAEMTVAEPEKKAVEKTKHTVKKRAAKSVEEKPKETLEKQVRKTKAEKPKKAAKPKSTKQPGSKLPKWALPAAAGLIVVLAIAAYFVFFAGGNVKDVAMISFVCDEEIVQAGQEIFVYYYWAAKEAEQVDAFFDVVEHYVAVNDVWYDIRKTGLDEIRFNEENGWYERRFWMNIGSLNKPGWYVINTVVDIKVQVFDGFGWSGPGTNNSRIDVDCRIQVVE